MSPNKRDVFLSHGQVSAYSFYKEQKISSFDMEIQEMGFEVLKPSLNFPEPQFPILGSLNTIT